MNKEKKLKEYDIGDLIKIQSGCLGMICDKRISQGIKLSFYGKDFMYKVHFCEELVPDNRWIFTDDIKEKMR